MIIVPHQAADNAQRGRNGTNSFSRWGVNAEDLRTTHLLDEQEHQGEFVLENERPLRRKFIEYDLRGTIARAAAERCSEYTQVFARFGIPSEDSGRLQRHLAKIHFASLEAEVAIQQVLDAQWRYDQRLRKLLDGKAYASYREYELMKPAVREYDEMANAAAKRGIRLDPTLRDEVVRLLHDVSAYTHRPAYGPFDPLPDGAVGESNVIDHVSRRQSQLAEKSRQFLLVAEERGLPIAVRLASSNHFSAKMSEMQAAIDVLRHRPERNRNRRASPRLQ
jgi:hypothetical protein